MKVAKLNLRAGVKAIASGSYGPACDYLAQGIRLLPTDHWKSEYRLSLELYSMAGQAEFYVGNFDLAMKYAQIVINQDDIHCLVTGHDALGQDVRFHFPVPDPSTGWLIECRVRRRLIAEAEKMGREGDRPMMPEGAAGDVAA